ICFDRSRSITKEPFSVPLARVDQVVLRGIARCANSRANAATACGNFPIGGATCPLLELVGANSGENRMSVRVNKPGHHHPTFGINDLTILADGRFDLAPPAGRFDSIASYQHRAVFDDRKLAQFSARAGTMRS